MTFSFDDLCKNDPVRSCDPEPMQERALSVSEAFFTRAIAEQPANYEFTVAPAPICGVYYDRNRGLITAEEGEAALDNRGFDEHPTITRKAVMAEGWLVKVDPKDEVEGLLRAWAYLRSCITLTKNERLLVGWYARWTYRAPDQLRSRLWLLVLPSLKTLDVGALAGGK